MSTMRGKEDLRPSLWRTCRALMNPLRLRIFKDVFTYEGEFCVRQFARKSGITDSLASTSLRLLNSRGLLGVRRDKIKVFYNTDPDRSLPEAVEIQHAFRKYFAQDLSDGWERQLVKILKAFSHFNRLAMIVRLAKGPASSGELETAVGVFVKSPHHHLRYLKQADLVECVRSCRGPSEYRLVPQTHVISKVLLKTLLSDTKGAERYYNPGRNGCHRGGSQITVCGARMKTKQRVPKLRIDPRTGDPYGDDSGSYDRPRRSAFPFSVKDL